MALTLAQAALLSNDVVRQGVIEAIVKESGLLERLPFIEMVGNSLKYNRELTLAGAEFFAVRGAGTGATSTGGPGRRGKRAFLMMTRTQRRGISAYARSLTSPVTYQPSELGQRVMFYDGIPIVVNDHQLHTEVITIGGLEVTAAAGGTGASIFALKVGEGHRA